MVVMVAKYHVKPGNVEAVLDALRKMAPLVKQHEPGCTKYYANVSRDDPNLIMLYEEYESEEALQAHRETEHFKQYIEGTAVPLLEKREREFFTPVQLG